MRALSLVLLPLVVLGCRRAAPDVDVDDIDHDGDGVGASLDCDDEDPAVFPGATERCNGIDDDCDGVIDEDAEDATTFYADADGDGYGDASDAVTACEAPSGYTDQDGDCDDTDAAFHPGATEDDCADPADYNCDGSTGYADADNDGFAACDDCDDGDAAINPDAAEICNGVDDDCDDAIDEDAADATTWYADTDGDGFGDPDGATVQACAAPEGFVASADDCDDTAAAIFPGADERCNDLDDDCDGEIDEDPVDLQTFYRDVDSDGHGDPDADTIDACVAPRGYVLSSDDCDDDHFQVYPGAEELCDGLDNDCDGSIPDDEADADGDGVRICDGDCDDTDATIHPGLDETCGDGKDNDCDGLTDAFASGDPAAPSWFEDIDGDGYGSAPFSGDTVPCAQPANHVDNDDDCDDTSDIAFDVNPAATEVCDDVDNDCSGEVDDVGDLNDNGIEDCDEHDVVLHMNADDRVKIYLDGELFWDKNYNWNVAPYSKATVLGPGDHVVAAHARDAFGVIAAFIGGVEIDGVMQYKTGSGDWLHTRTAPVDDTWLEFGYDDSAWSKPFICTSTPWGTPSDGRRWVWWTASCGSSSLGQAWFRVEFNIPE